MSSETHHWVPKFLLKQFTDTSGRVFRYDIHTEKVTKPPPKHAASKAGFYEFEIEGKIISFEDHLEKVETKAAPILRRLITAQSLADITSEERQHVSNFVAAQSFRTEAFYKGLDVQPTHQAFGAIFSQLWRSAFITANEIAHRHWALMVIDTDDYFYLGDNPVVLQRTENPSDGKNLGFDIAGVETFMPLSPKHALYMPCKTTSKQIIDCYENAQQVDYMIRSINLRGIQIDTKELDSSQDAMQKLRPIYSAFKAGSPLIASSPNVENLNYLQCSWAHAAIYSHSNAFAFAKQVFLENPQYRTTPIARLVQFGTST